MIKINNLSFAYEAGKNVIHNISLEIPKGNYVVILGPNGSGKSTLVRLITGLLSCNKGSIWIDDLKLEEKNIQQIHKKIGIVFQNPDNQFIGATVEDDIAFGLENNKIPTSQMKSIIKEYAAYTGMLEFLDKEPSNLSGGQKQRAAIAGVLAMHPKILILDEATSMLDPKGKKEITSLIFYMRKIIPDLTIISITHEVNEAQYADEVIVLNEGKIYLKGTPEEVFCNEEKLAAASLSLPFLHYVKKSLCNQNVILHGKSQKEMVDEICQLILNK